MSLKTWLRDHVETGKAAALKRTLDEALEAYH